MTELNFATSDAEAAERAARFLASDPFPSIPLALLSAAEIDDYARLTGLLYPFDSRSLKSASYEVHIGGEFIRWDGEGRRVDAVERALVHLRQRNTPAGPAEELQNPETHVDLRLSAA